MKGFSMKKIDRNEPVPAWRVRLCTLLAHKKIPAEIKTDIRTCLAEMDQLRAQVAEFQRGVK